MQIIQLFAALLFLAIHTGAVPQADPDPAYTAPGPGPSAGPAPASGMFLPAASTMTLHAYNDPATGDPVPLDSVKFFGRVVAGSDGTLAISQDPIVHSISDPSVVIQTEETNLHVIYHPDVLTNQERYRMYIDPGAQSHAIYAKGNTNGTEVSHAALGTVERGPNWIVAWNVRYEHAYTSETGDPTFLVRVCHITDDSGEKLCWAGRHGDTIHIVTGANPPADDELFFMRLLPVTTDVNVVKDDQDSTGTYADAFGDQAADDGTAPASASATASATSASAPVTSASAPAT
ncbi:hypothetical protein C8F01DRAFT_1366704 [Mycena amicta]|nr:hypothetical protein C8F01DRAFT_1366704 [Mycena amicta]